MAALYSRRGGSPPLITSVLPVDASKVVPTNLRPSFHLNEDWTLGQLDESVDAANLRRAATELRETDIPVAFPTETVYGLGADVTRSSAVQGIFKAKQRPSDNPLIVHVSSLKQLRHLLDPKAGIEQREQTKFCPGDEIMPRRLSDTELPLDQYKADPIPVIYQPLIQKFWPGPLTLIMPNPKTSVLASEVTAGLQTFGVRMPRNLVALSLIHITGVPLAAPSANASSRPSPTTAAHVKHDLDGRISTIIDGGPCEVGVESTVVDGLSSPPTILRPGGISLDQLRSCHGWENVVIGYQDASEKSSAPKAPGMKYKHYSPRAVVILFEFGQQQPDFGVAAMHGKRIGLIRTNSWKSPAVAHSASPNSISTHLAEEKSVTLNDSSGGGTPNGNLNGELLLVRKACKFEIQVDGQQDKLEVWDIGLGNSPNEVAKGLFSALRELDNERVDAILVEGIDDACGDVAAAVMNRLRKAAETTVAFS